MNNSPDEMSGMPEGWGQPAQSIQTQNPEPEPAPQLAPVADAKSKIRLLAGNLERLAFHFCAMGILGLIWGISTASSSAPEWMAIVLGAGGISAALWLFILAQLVHIRANTEK